MFTPQTGMLMVDIVLCLKHYAFGDLFVSAAHIILTNRNANIKKGGFAN